MGRRRGKKKSGGASEVKLHHPKAIRVQPKGNARKAGSKRPQSGNVNTDKMLRQLEKG